MRARAFVSETKRPAAFQALLKGKTKMCLRDIVNEIHLCVLHISDCVHTRDSHTFRICRRTARFQ